MSTGEDDTVNRDAANNKERTSLILAGLNRLDVQYHEMKETQSALLQALEKLEQEEAALARAVAISQEQTLPRQRPPPKKKNTEDEVAIQRLEEALLNEDNSEDEEETNA